MIEVKKLINNEKNPIKNTNKWHLNQSITLEHDWGDKTHKQWEKPNQKYKQMKFKSNFTLEHDWSEKTHKQWEKPNQKNKKNEIN